MKTVIYLFYLYLIHYFLYLTNRFCQCNFININDPESYSEYMNMKSSNGDLTTITFMPTSRDHIYKVLDGGYTIWRSNSIASVLSYLKVYGLKSKPLLCFAHVYNSLSIEERFFCFGRDGWKEIDLLLFECKLRKLYLERSLDITSISENSFSYFKQNIQGLTSHIIIPLDKYQLVRVEQDFDILWEKTQSQEHCTYVVVHGNLRTSTLVHLHIKRLDILREIFLAKIGGDWEQVSKENFYKILEMLDEIEDERKARGDEEDEEEDDEDD